MQLVVAHYREDLAWLKNIPKGVKPIVYSKSDDLPEGAIPLRNIGREAHAYLTHIVDRYDTLASFIPTSRGGDPPRLRQGFGGQVRSAGTSPIPPGREGEGVTVFCQGHPFDHCHDFHKQIARIFSSGLERPHFAWLGFIIDTDDRRGRRLHVAWSKNPEGRELDMERCHRTLFGDNGPEWYCFVVGAQFAVANDLILTRPKSFYQRALELCEEYEEASYCLERMWDRIFGMNYVTDDLLPAGQLTRYLKPIKRIGKEI